MAEKPHNPNPYGREGNPISLYPLTMNQSVEAIFQITPEDVKKIRAATPMKKGKQK